MRIRALCTTAVSLAAVLTGGVATAVDGPRPNADGARPHAAKAPASVREDFDGDGYQDLVTAAPGGAVAGRAEAGYIVVSYGSATGLKAARTTVISQNTAGVPDAAESQDHFGQRLAARDLDGDGLTDLAVASDERLDGIGNHGSVTVLWGRRGGLSGKGAAAVQAPAGSSGWWVGDDLTAGDFDGDGRSDLFMRHGADGEQRSVLFGPFDRSGAPAREQRLNMFFSDNDLWMVTAGDMTGDGIDDLATFYAFEEHAEGGRFWRGTPSGLSTEPTPLGSAAAATVGDFDRDGKGDLATRVVPGGILEDLPYDAGTVKIYYGTSSGPSRTRTTTITQNTAGVPGTSEKGDQFGARLDAGDVTGDGYADLAVGVPFEAVGSKSAAGSVVLLKGGRGGLRGTGAQAFDQDTRGVPGVAEAGDRFGGAVRLLDVTKDGKAELAVSAPRENRTGSVWSLRGTAAGLTATGSVALSPADVHAPTGTGDFGSRFANENDVFLYPPSS
ncbi:VCBS repeat-containing protein [Streptomyces sp. LX-29]|uniref:FG-GAP-like repeat-containing protein n=1 Tax=Streptomyces sp. LX-29 TaxID=2900152 RepID=UPI00240D0CF6|nr:FG-GAP-like repeat-containing protein [Streptomyces sp. LX-29]WFB11257.1 VCBS repeat-containing protein [Streptomyces sp. LX-29]